jgi:CubicO group peptidase (beta-lactamase class C family)
VQLFGHRVPASTAPAVIRPDTEVEPRAAGLPPDAAAAIWRSVEALYQTGYQPAVAFCLRRAGKVVFDRALGVERIGGPPATPDSWFNLFSASKAVTAMVVHMLDDRGLIHLDDAICEYIPEFGKNGKEWITVRHVLTHRSGIPSVPGRKFDVDLLSDWDAILEVLCETRPVLAPGRRLAYHALTGGYVLGEVVRRVAGKDVRRLLREMVLDPLGMKSFDYGVRREDVPRVVSNVLTGPPVPFPLSWLVTRALGVSHADAVAVSNDRRFLEAIVPAGNVIGTADEACRFYQMLLDEGEQGGVRVCEPRTVRRAVAPQTYLEVDLTLALPVNYGMGFMLGQDLVSIYGSASPRAFGHVGFTNIVTYADPEREIAVALLTSGKPFLHTGLVKWLDVMRTISRVVPRTREVARRHVSGGRRRAS